MQLIWLAKYAKFNCRKFISGVDLVLKAHDELEKTLD